MEPPFFHFLPRVVVLLALVTVATAVAIYLLMAFQNHRLLTRQTRRAAFTNQLVPALTLQDLHFLWSRCGRRDREILEEILIEQCRLAGSEEANVAEKFLVAFGIYKRWLLELKSRRASRRARAARKLGHVQEPRGVEGLVGLAGDRSGEVQLAVTLSLGRLRDAAGLPGLIRLAEDPPATIPDLTLAAALAACAEKTPYLLVALLRASRVRTRVIAAWALSEVADATILPALAAAAQDPEPEVRAKVAQALARVPGEESLDVLRRLARDRIWYVRVRALSALGNHSAPSDLETILQGLEDPVPEVRSRAALALRRRWGMNAEIVAKVLTRRSRRSFNSLISEWDRAGFFRLLVAGLTTRDWRRFVTSRGLLKTLVSAGVTQSLFDLVLLFPDVKVRLRLVRLLASRPNPELAAELEGLIQKPECDPRVANAIRRAFPGNLAAPNQESKAGPV